MAHLVKGKHALAQELGMSASQIDKVWRRWKAMPGFPGPAPGFDYVYNADAYRRWLDGQPGANDGRPAAATPQAGRPEPVRQDYSQRMAAAAASIAGEV